MENEKPKEAVYDAEIAPLMSKIITLCKAHKINMAATFALDTGGDEDEPIYCTTVLPVDADDEYGLERVMDCLRVMQPPVAKLFTITSGAKP